MRAVTSAGSVEALRAAARRALDDVPPGDAAALDAWRRSWLGRRSELAAVRRGLRDVPVADRPSVARAVDAAVADLEARWAALAGASAAATRPPLPPLRRPLSRAAGLHPLTQVTDEALDVLAHLGFDPFPTPHVEVVDVNFSLLGVEPGHVTRDERHTFYVTDETVMRSHLSSGQARALLAHAPAPFRTVAYGACYRREHASVRSDPQFHQVEPVAVGPEVRMTDLKATVTAVLGALLAPDWRLRWRPASFPFATPGWSVDAECSHCAGSGCALCRRAGWLELLGGGLLEPGVLRRTGYDPDTTRGFAFGLALDRVLLLRHGVDDIRHLLRNDLRVLSQLT